jgi:hypothetical protein
VALTAEDLHAFLFENNVPRLERQGLVYSKTGFIRQTHDASIAQARQRFERWYFHELLDLAYLKKSKLLSRAASREKYWNPHVEFSSDMVEPPGTVLLGLNHLITLSVPFR